MINQEKKISLNGIWQSMPLGEISGGITSTGFQSFKKVKIPGNWELQSYHNYDGSIWYVKEFYAAEAEPLNPEVSLCFSGVDYRCTVILNDTILGRHEGYFQPFSFPVTDVLHYGAKNVLQVVVESPREEAGPVWPLKKELIKGIFNHHDCRPGGWSMQHGQDRNTGGIWNDVYLQYHKPVIVEQVRILTKQIKTGIHAKVSAEIVVENRGSKNCKTDLTVSVEKAGISKGRESRQITVKPGKQTITVPLIIPEPELWFPWDLGEQPLYTLLISGVHIDSVTEQFGLRSFSTNEKREFFINGKRLFLRGTNIIPEQFLSLLSDKKIERQVSMMKEANINIVRVHAHVCRKEFYEACDRAGILVWQDFPLQWTYSDSKEFADEAVKQIGDMVNHLYNHASIAYWCCHNEPGEQIRTLDERLYEKVISLDSSRIVRKASNYEEHPYDGWYWGDKEHYAAAPMGPLVTEFGAQALPVLQSLQQFLPVQEGLPKDWSEWVHHNFQPKQTFCVAQVQTGGTVESFIENSQKYQSEVIETAVEFYRRKKNNGITGVFQFMFMDCWESITWSVVDYYFKKKPGYSTLQKVFQPLYISLKPMRVKHVADDEVQFSVWLINDLHKSFVSCTMKVFFGKKSVFTKPIGTLESDSIEFFSFEEIRFKLEKKVSPGKYPVRVCLYQQGMAKPVAESSFSIEIITI